MPLTSNLGGRALFKDEDHAGIWMEKTISCRPIRLRYSLRIPNVGDLISPAVVSGVSGHPTVHVADGVLPHLIAGGSLMATATPRSHVWGAGVMHPDFGVGSIASTNIHAVRGKLSHAALRKQGVGVADMPLGDPAYLGPALLGIARAAAPRFRLGIVPNYVDRKNPLFVRLHAEPGVTNLNVHDDPDTFLREMATCEAVVSSSLHGLIFAEALRIPNLWVGAGDEIAAGAFKFHDWFSTSATPQTSILPLDPDMTVEDLVGRATLHESTIDVEELKAAFPHDLLNEIREAKERPILPPHACRARPIPTFLISYNRGAMLEKTIASIARLSRPTQIVVHDNGSTDFDTLAVLDKLESSGVRVSRREAITSADDLNNVDETVQDFFQDWSEPSRYIVSDCDVDMSVAAPEALDVYDELLNTFRHVASVGPMLRIRDIPRTYPLFNRVINRHVQQYWNLKPLLAETAFGPIAYLDTGIDTTLGLQRAGEPYRRCKRALRVYEPYEARHLDWYITSIGDDAYSTTSSSAISHWNNVAERDAHMAAGLEHDQYFAVRRKETGGLEIYEEKLV